MSLHPELAMPAAERLRNLVRDAGHLLHMPTNIDVLCDIDWCVLEGNSRAIAADHKFLQREGAINFYTLYRCHNYLFKLYGAMFLGQYAPALAAANQMIEALPEDLLAVEVPPMADWLEGFVPMRMHVLIRFGKWRGFLSRRPPPNPGPLLLQPAQPPSAQA